MNIEKSLEKILRQIALSDGVISEEEQKLITSVVINIEKYKELLNDALSDGLITEIEFHKLFESRLAVIEKSYESARDDDKISDDEAILLRSICKFVMQMV